MLHDLIWQADLVLFQVVREPLRPEIGAVGELLAAVVLPAEATSGVAEVRIGDPAACLEVAHDRGTRLRIPARIDKPPRMWQPRLVRRVPESDALNGAFVETVREAAK